MCARFAPGEHVHGAATAAKEADRIVVRVFCGHRENGAIARMPPWKDCVIVAVPNDGVPSVLVDDDAYRPVLR